MTDKDLKVKCIPMHARFSEEQCEKQRNGGRDYCVNCERGKGISSGKFRNVFNSSPPPGKITSKPIENLEPGKHRREKIKAAAVAKAKKSASVKALIIQRVKAKPLNKCPNCGVPVGKNKKWCSPCSKAPHVLGLERSRILARIRRKRKAGEIYPGRYPGDKRAV